MQFLYAEIQFLRQLPIRRRTPKRPFQMSYSFFIALDVLTHADGNPVLCTQVVKHRTAYAYARIGLKFIAARELVPFDCIEQTKETAAQKIFPIDVLGQADGDASGNQTYEREIVFGNTVSHLNGLFRLIRLPQSLNILFYRLRHLHHLLSAHPSALRRCRCCGFLIRRHLIHRQLMRLIR